MNPAKLVQLPPVLQDHCVQYLSSTDTKEWESVLGGAPECKDLCVAIRRQQVTQVWGYKAWEVFRNTYRNGSASLPGPLGRHHQACLFLSDYVKSKHIHAGVTEKLELRVDSKHLEPDSAAMLAFLTAPELPRQWREQVYLVVLSGVQAVTCIQGTPVLSMTLMRRLYPQATFECRCIALQDIPVDNSGSPLFCLQLRYDPREEELRLATPVTSCPRVELRAWLCAIIARSNLRELDLEGLEIADWPGLWTKLLSPTRLQVLRLKRVTLVTTQGLPLLVSCELPADLQTLHLEAVRGVQVLTQEKRSAGQSGQRSNAFTYGHGPLVVEIIHCVDLERLDLPVSRLRLQADQNSQRPTITLSYKLAVLKSLEVQHYALATNLPVILPHHVELLDVKLPASTCFHAQHCVTGRFDQVQNLQGLVDTHEAQHATWEVSGCTQLRQLLLRNTKPGFKCTLRGCAEVKLELGCVESLLLATCSLRQARHGELCFQWLPALPTTIATLELSHLLGLQRVTVAPPADGYNTRATMRTNLEFNEELISVTLAPVASLKVFWCPYLQELVTPPLRLPCVLPQSVSVSGCHLVSRLRLPLAAGFTEVEACPHLRHLELLFPNDTARVSALALSDSEGKAHDFVAFAVHVSGCASLSREHILLPTNSAFFPHPRPSLTFEATGTAAEHAQSPLQPKELPDWARDVRDWVTALRTSPGFQEDSDSE